MCIRVMCHKFCIIQPQMWHHPVLLQMMMVHVYHSIICIMRPVLSANVEFIYKYVRKMLHKILMSCVIVVSSYQCWALLSLHIPQWNRLWTFSHPNTLFTVVWKKRTMLRNVRDALSNRNNEITVLWQCEALTTWNMDIARVVFIRP